MAGALYILASCLLPAPPLLALDESRLADGANHLRAHEFADGAGVRLGIIDPGSIGIKPANHLGSRLLGQFDFRDLTPSQSPIPIADPADGHETLVADVAAGDHSLYSGVAPGALVFDAGINDTDSMRASIGWLHANHDVAVFNLSFGFGLNDNGTNTMAKFSDWFVRHHDGVIVHSAGNSGGQINLPGDSYNGITVGAYQQSFDGQKRWFASAYQLLSVGGTEVRGKPDILAPGASIQDGIAFGNPIGGTSFAAPHVAGTVALVQQYAADHLPGSDLNHLGVKSLILNSARKRAIAAPEADVPISSDHATTVAAPYDLDYLAAGELLADHGSAASTAAWTPSEWTYDGATFSAPKPLDDEQGVGFLDATRALVNLAGGRQASGTVGGIGWDQGTVDPLGGAVAGSYALDQLIPSGGFITATLTWDRVVAESDGDGIVDDDDTYTSFELANLDLQIVDALDNVIAESISTTDNVEHLHVPVPSDGLPGDYRIDVLYSGGATLATDYALAWWTSQTPLLPGDYNLDGVVDAADYDVWLASAAGPTSPLVHGDGNNDGRADAADYTIWQDHRGSAWVTSGTASSLAAIPEPATLVLLACAGLACVGARREGRGVRREKMIRASHQPLVDSSTDRMEQLGML